MEMTRAIIYARVSGEEQDPQNQIMVLTEWSRQRFEVVHVYQEQESAWRDGHQLELAKVIKAARAGQFKVVLVWSLDRLSRGGSRAILTLVHRLATYGVRVISYQELWTEAPGELGELLYSISGWVAQMESQRISERTKAGLQRALAEGKTLGRPHGSKDKRKRKKRSVRLPIYEAVSVG